MKRHVNIGILSATGLSVLAAAHSLAVPFYSFPGTWNEGAYYNSFGGGLPAGIVEGSAGFSTIGDYDGRTIGLAGVTTNKTDPTPLTTINTGLFSGTDANVYAIQITAPAAFTASITSTSLILALFGANGTAIQASVGGVADPITGVTAGITTPGIYYLAIADPGLYPQNNAAQNLFGLTGAAGVFAPVSTLTDKALSTTPSTAFLLPTSSSPLLSNTSFTAPGSAITLTSAGFAVVPEPASIGLLGTATLGLLARRRRPAR